MGQLDQAAKAYSAAQAALTSAQRTAQERIVAARERVTATRSELAAAIVAEGMAGTPQVEIMKRSGYSRERVRSILRAGGVEPAD